MVLAGELAQNKNVLPLVSMLDGDLPTKLTTRLGFENSIVALSVADRMRPLIAADAVAAVRAAQDEDAAETSCRHAAKRLVAPFEV